MEKLQISKRGLFLTLKDLTDDGLIMRDKRGRNTIISISPKGMNFLRSNRENDTDIVEQTFLTTIQQLEENGLISEDWDEETKDEFLTKIRQEIRNKLKDKQN